MIVAAPSFDQSLKGHTFKLQDPPTFSINLNTPDEAIPADLSGNVSANIQLVEFYTEFLKQAARYFSRPLELQQFQKRISHKWERDLSQTPLQASHNIRFCLCWIPVNITFFPTRYEINWSLKSIQPIIADGVLSGSISENQNSSAPPVVCEIAAADIPMKQPNQTKEGRVRAKKIIRHARLRIALAQLRAERLAEKYYKKYGTFECSDSNSDDSVLSVDSEGNRPEERETSPDGKCSENIGSR